MPPYVSTFNTDYPSSTYTGPVHRPFVPDEAGLKDLRLHGRMSPARLDDRRQLAMRVR